MTTQMCDICLTKEPTQTALVPTANPWTTLLPLPERTSGSQPASSHAVRHADGIRQIESDEYPPAPVEPDEPSL